MKRMSLAILSALLLTSGLSLITEAQADTFKTYDVDLVTDASVLGNGDLQLTPGTGGQVGAAWLTTPWSTSQSFSVTFSFSLQENGSISSVNAIGLQADGISFALQSQGLGAIGVGGGDVGYSGLGGVGSVVQTWDNNRVGLNTDGDAYNTQAAPTGANLGAANLVTGTETVSYDASTHFLTMSGNLNVDGNPFLVQDSTAVDLAAKFLGGSMYAGFTGGTGLSWADQRITDFRITPVPEPETYALMLAGLGLIGFVARRSKQNAA